MGLTTSHTTFMQHIKEQIQPAKIVEVGTRSVCKDELAYAKKANIDFISTAQIVQDGAQKTLQTLQQKLQPYENIYLTVDMDVLDPAFAPAVQNPEPAGIDTNTLLDLVCGLCDKRVVGFDVVEIAPSYDQGVSAIVAAKVMFEMFCQLEKSRKQ
jgi:agmatinase